MANPKYVELIPEWTKLYEEGMSFRKIAESYQVSKATVSKNVSQKTDVRPKNQSAVHIQDWIKMYNNGHSLRNIGDAYGVSNATVWRHIKEHVEMRPAPFEKEKQFLIYEKEWIDLYQYGCSLSEIASLYQTTVQNVSNYIDDKVELRDYSDSSKNAVEFSYDFFEKIDNDEKAYWLGALYASGSLFKFHTNKGLIFSAKRDNLHQIERFKKVMNTKKQFDYNKEDDIYNLRLSKPKTYEDLKKIGFSKNKNNILSYPNIEGRYDRYFILGYFETKMKMTSTKNGFEMIVLGSNSLLIHIHSIFSSLELVKELNLTPQAVSRGKLIYTNESEICSILEFIYTNNPFALPSKKENVRQYFHKKRDL